ETARRRSTVRVVALDLAVDTATVARSRLLVFQGRGFRAEMDRRHVRDGAFLEPAVIDADIETGTAWAPMRLDSLARRSCNSCQNAVRARTVGGFSIEPRLAICSCRTLPSIRRVSARLS